MNSPSTNALHVFESHKNNGLAFEQGQLSFVMVTGNQLTVQDNTNDTRAYLQQPQSTFLSTKFNSRARVEQWSWARQNTRVCVLEIPTSSVLIDFEVRTRPPS